jgi:hypothetical protein
MQRKSWPGRHLNQTLSVERDSDPTSPDPIFYHTSWGSESQLHQVRNPCNHPRRHQVRSQTPQENLTRTSPESDPRKVACCGTVSPYGQLASWSAKKELYRTSPEPDSECRKGCKIQTSPDPIFDCTKEKFEDPNPSFTRSAIFVTTLGVTRSGYKSIIGKSWPGRHRNQIHDK